MSATDRDPSTMFASQAGIDAHHKAQLALDGTLKLLNPGTGTLDLLLQQFEGFAKRVPDPLRVPCRCAAVDAASIGQLFMELSEALLQAAAYRRCPHGFDHDSSFRCCEGAATPGDHSVEGGSGSGATSFPPQSQDSIPRLFQELALVLEHPDASVSQRWARLRRLRISQLLNDINQLGDRDEQGLPINDPGLWLAEIVAQLVLDDRFDLGKAGEAVLNLHGHRLIVRVLRNDDQGEIR